MTMHRVTYPEADVDRLHIPKNDGRRGMISIEDYVCRNGNREPEKACRKQK